MLLKGLLGAGRSSDLWARRGFIIGLNHLTSRFISSVNSGNHSGKVKRAHVTYRSFKRIVPCTNVQNLQQNFLNIFSDTIEGYPKLLSPKMFIFQRFDEEFGDFVDLSLKDELQDKAKVEVKVKQDILPYNDQEEDVDLNFSQGDIKLHLKCKRFYNHNTPWIDNYVPEIPINDGEKYKLWSMMSTEGDGYLSLDEDQEGNPFLQANGKTNSASVFLTRYSGSYGGESVCRLVFSGNDERFYVIKVDKQHHLDACVTAEKIEKCDLDNWDEVYIDQMFYEYPYPAISHEIDIHTLSKHTRHHRPTSNGRQNVLCRMYESVSQENHYLAADGCGLPYLVMSEERNEPDPGALFMRVSGCQVVKQDSSF